MSRAQDYTRQLTDQQLASLNSLNQQFLGQQQVARPRRPRRETAYWTGFQGFSLPSPRRKLVF